MPIPLTDVSTQWTTAATTTHVDTATSDGVSMTTMASQELIHFPDEAGANAYIAALRRAVATCNRAHPSWSTLRLAEPSGQTRGSLLVTQDPAGVEAFAVSGSTAVRLVVTVPHPGARANAAALQLATEAVTQARHRLHW